MTRSLSPFRAATAALAAVTLMSTPRAQEPTPLAAGTLAPDFVSRTLAGADVHLADFKGKVVVLDFWATWCGPCLQSLPHTQEVAAAHKAAGVVILAVCTSDSRSKFEAWTREHAAQYPDLQFTCDPNDRSSNSFDDRASQKLYHVGGLPTRFVIGRDGKIAATLVGDEPGDVRLEAGLARAGIAIDAQVAARGETQIQKAQEEAVRRARAAADNPPPTFFPQWGRLKSGEAMPELALTDRAGKALKLSELRGKPTVLCFAWSEIVPIGRLQEVVDRFGGYGVNTLAVVVGTPQAEFTAWHDQNQKRLSFRAGWDPAGKYTGAANDQDARMAHHRQSALGQVFGGGMYPAMPSALLVDAEGRFAGAFPFGPTWSDGLGNLLLHLGVKLAPEHMPTKVAPPEAFVVKAPPPPEARVEPIKVGAVAPDFTTQELDGAPVRLSDYAGKVVVLDFWATWCGPCKASLPHTQEVARTYKNQDVVVLASCTNDDRKAFERWVQDNREKYPDIRFSHDVAERAPERASRKHYGVSGIPMQFVVGKDGRIAAIVEGYMQGEVLLEEALAKAGVKVEQSVLDQAVEDHKKRDARAGKTVPALPLGGVRRN